MGFASWFNLTVHRAGLVQLTPGWVKPRYLNLMTGDLDSFAGFGGVAVGPFTAVLAPADWLKGDCIPCTFEWLDNGLVGRVEEEWDREPVNYLIHGFYPVQGSGIGVDRPDPHHVADIDHEGGKRRRYMIPECA